jgi:Ca2+-binding EF-hand superfamily protein
MTSSFSQVFGAIREIFQVFDTNGDKALDAAELRHAFACMVMRSTVLFLDN